MAGYFEYARAAKSYEQEEDWLHAMRLWGMAAGAAGQYTKNGKWAMYRVQFCKHAYERSLIEVNESIMRRYWESNRDLKKRAQDEAKKQKLREALAKQLAWKV